MLKKILLPFIIFIILEHFSSFQAQSQEPLNSKQDKSLNLNPKGKKKSGKPLVKKENAQRKKLFSKNKSDKVPPGYAFDKRETAPKKLTDNPNAKQILPKNQQKRLAAKHKKIGKFLKKKKKIP